MKILWQSEVGALYFGAGNLRIHFEELYSENVALQSKLKPRKIREHPGALAIVIWMQLYVHQARDIHPGSHVPSVLSCGFLNLTSGKAQ